MMLLCDLPTEIILYVAKHLPSRTSISRFSRTNNRFHSILNPYLYRFDVRHGRASALRWAARHSNVEVARKSLDAGANIHDEARTCPHLNIFQEALCSRYKIKRRSTMPFQTDEYWRKYTLRVHSMPCEENDSMLLLLLERGADIDSMFVTGATPLCVAVSQPDTLLAQLLIANGANVNFANDDGNTILHEASTGCNEEVTRSLVAKGANVHSKNIIGHTPLHEAARGRLVHQLWTDIKPSNCGPIPDPQHCRTQCRRVLLKCGADDGAADPYDVDVRGEVVRILIENGADIEAKTDEGATPLLFGALYHAKAKVLRVLVENGARTDVLNNHGTTFLEVAKTRKDLMDILVGRSSRPEEGR
ncbi:hypothetical protein GX50_01688 [[Emmonsia] crescens]|uniref:Uncharacterized protein n=1 Tax=[Emmonsia] crescens TaxID=73230 RepID=A0A2B7ZQK5_9EURO|nr:hypothetical protein GX50_01688 [Emmonsia crescens]